MKVFWQQLGFVAAFICVENVVTRSLSTMSVFCRSSSTHGWTRSCGGCSGIQTMIQLTNAAAQTRRRRLSTLTCARLSCRVYQSLKYLADFTVIFYVHYYACHEFPKKSWPNKKILRMRCTLRNTKHWRIYRILERQSVGKWCALGYLWRTSLGLAFQ